MEATSRRSILAASATGALLTAAGRASVQPAQAAAPVDAPTMDSLRRLIEAARANSPELADLMVRHLPGLQAGGAAAVPPSDTVPTAGTTTVGTVASSNVAAVWGQDALFALRSDQPAAISIDTQAPVPMTRVDGTDYWFRLETLRIGTTHRFALFSGGRDVGANAVAGYTPDSYPIEGTARGTLSEKRTVTSRIYGGAQADCWLYANAGIDTARGAPLMVWQDGQNCVGARPDQLPHADRHR